MIKIQFNDFEELLKFLNNIPNFQDWEVIDFDLKIKNGENILIDTQVNTGSPDRKYKKFSSIQNTINSFYDENYYKPIVFNMKLKLPNTLKSTIDNKNQYKEFYINLYSNTQISYVTISFLEKGKNLPKEPIKNWALYILNLYHDWRKRMGY
jgi:hypothetical protein